MAKKIKYRGTNVPERASSGGSIPGITGSESVQRNYFLHQLHSWQDSNGHRTIRSNLESMFSDFPDPNRRIKANVTTRSDTSTVRFSTSNSYVKAMNYIPPKVTLRRSYYYGEGTLPTDRDYMRYLIVGAGGGGGKGTSPRLGTGTGGAGGGGGSMTFGEAKIGGYGYRVGAGGAGATSDGSRGGTGGTSSLSSGTHYIYAYGGQGGGNSTTTGDGGGVASNFSANSLLSHSEIKGSPGGRNRSWGLARGVPVVSAHVTLGMGDLIDGGSGFEWGDTLKSSGLFGTSNVAGGPADDVLGGSGGGGASLGQGGSYPRSGAQRYPSNGGGGGGGPGKGGNGQDGARGAMHIFW